MSEKARRPFRFRWFMKWTGTIACVLLSGAFIASRWVGLDTGFHARSNFIFARIQRGAVSVDNFGLPRLIMDKTSGRIRVSYLNENSIRCNVLENYGTDWWPTPMREGTWDAWFIRIPLWIPAAACLALTALLWRLDRRRPLPGHCRKCNYNLTGNTSGVCPECGTAIAAVAESPGGVPAPSAEVPRSSAEPPG